MALWTNLCTQMALASSMITLRCPRAMPVSCPRSANGPWTIIAWTILKLTVGQCWIMTWWALRVSPTANSHTQIKPFLITREASCQWARALKALVPHWIIQTRRELIKSRLRQVLTLLETMARPILSEILKRILIRTVSEETHQKLIAKARHKHHPGQKIHLHLWIEAVQRSNTIQSCPRFEKIKQTKIWKNWSIEKQCLYLM